MSENRRASIELEFKWLQTRPETIKNVISKLNSLKAVYGHAIKFVKKSTMTDLQKSMSLRELKTQYKKQKNALRELGPAEKMAAEAIRKGGIEANKEKKALNGLTSQQKNMKES